MAQRHFVKKKNNNNNKSLFTEAQPRCIISKTLFY